MKRFLPVMCVFVLSFIMSGSGLYQGSIYPEKGGVPEFNQGIRIQANGSDINVGKVYTAPCVADWNEDGKKDLLVGTFYNGNVHLFLNSGTNTQPVFTKSVMLKADREIISVPYT